MRIYFDFPMILLLNKFCPNFFTEEEDETDGVIDSQLVAKVLEDTYNRQKKRTSDSQKARQVSKAIQAPQLPHPNSGLAKCLQDWAKEILQISKETHVLPEPPNPDELANLANHLSERTAAVTKAINEVHAQYKSTKGKLERKLLQKLALKKVRQNYKPPSHLAKSVNLIKSSQKFSLLHIQACQIELHQNCISRCTYDWTSTHTSQWNSIFIEILISHWNKCINSCGSGPTYSIDQTVNTPAIQAGLLQRWFEGQRKQY